MQASSEGPTTVFVDVPREPQRVDWGHGKLNEVKDRLPQLSTLALGPQLLLGNQQRSPYLQPGQVPMMVPIPSLSPVKL